MLNIKESSLSFLLLAAVLTVFNVAFVLRSTMTIKQNGIVYEQVGMAANKTPDGDVIYIPVYKPRIEK